MFCNHCGNEFQQWSKTADKTLCRLCYTNKWVKNIKRPGKLNYCIQCGYPLAMKNTQTKFGKPYTVAVSSKLCEVCDPSLKPHREYSPPCLTPSQYNLFTTSFLRTLKLVF